MTNQTKPKKYSYLNPLTKPVHIYIETNSLLFFNFLDNFRFNDQIE